MLSLGLILSVSLPNLATACMGVSSETRTFLDRLPANAMSKPLVARVQILASQTEKNVVKIGKKTVENDSKIMADTKVIEALKGTQSGATIKIEVLIHSCSREPKVALGQSYYIAGSMDRDGVFHGEWRNSELESK